MMKLKSTQTTGWTTPKAMKAHGGLTGKNGSAQNQVKKYPRVSLERILR